MLPNLVIRDCWYRYRGVWGRFWVFYTRFRTRFLEQFHWLSRECTVSCSWLKRFARKNVCEFQMNCWWILSLNSLPTVIHFSLTFFRILITSSSGRLKNSGDCPSPCQATVILPSKFFTKVAVNEQFPCFFQYTSNYSSAHWKVLIWTQVYFLYYRCVTAKSHLHFVNIEVKPWWGLTTKYSPKRLYQWAQRI